MRACNKFRYKDSLDAQIALAHIVFKTKGSKKRQECRYYRCSVCNGYHLTSKRLATA